ncbi:hypothetical protein MKW94_010141 [Papaver nudicaule]|uniref:BED-type domain-containing protein n=1 Tax=Papaver nudicaule TaxID=74823 RepID=A0AA42AZE7_PAPNU|nr:hypothetical protein [Papaver nudicaule]
MTKLFGNIALQPRDIAWEWAESRDTANKHVVHCKLCGKKMSGGIHRFKKHIMQIKGQVTSCREATVEIMRKIGEDMALKNQSKSHKNHIDAILTEVCFLHMKF